jgi:hypothetical protein
MNYPRNTILCSGDTRRTRRQLLRRGHWGAIWRCIPISPTGTWSLTPQKEIIRMAQLTAPHNS